MLHRVQKEDNLYPKVQFEVIPNSTLGEVRCHTMS